MSNLVEHARRELVLSGQAAEDSAYAESIVKAVEAFAAYDGHSGASMMLAVEQLHTLLNFGNLAPLTNDPAEWLDHSEGHGSPMWQSRRNGAAFSVDRAATYYLVDQPDEIHATKTVV